MSAQFAVCLDSRGNALIPDGYEIVDSETRFLTAALQGTPIAVRGEAVCRWAARFFAGRGIRVADLRSPSEDLLAMCPSLSSEDVERILDAAGDLWGIPDAQPTLSDILTVIYPDGPWQSAPSGMHAAGWILWLDSHEVLGYTSALLSSQAALWESAQGGPERQAYGVTTSDDAAAMIRRWLRLDPNAGTDLGVFPAAIPDKWLEAAREYWTTEVIRTDGQFFESFRNQSLPRRLIQMVAQITSDYFRAHPEKLSVREIRVLEDYLDFDTTSRLYEVVPPRSPSDVPETVPLLLDWFRDEYLPYRAWESSNGDDAAHHRVSVLARTFADWYLHFYPAALSGAEGKGYLSITKSAALLADTEQSVILWVVLDGLHQRDAAELSRLIQERCPRLQCLTNELLFAPVPTITEFAKPALLSGLPPALAAELRQQDLAAGFTRISEGKDPSLQLRSSRAGDRFVWLLSEPDKTYHKPNDSSTTKILVSAQLSAVAERIASVVSATPDALNLRIVLSTDHGRVMGRGSRLHAIPSGCSGRGRAAWGPLPIQFPDAGYVVNDQDQLAYLSHGRFGLKDDCAVVLSEDAFVKSDGTGGQEEFSHGGMYPEEIIIPWVEFCRDVVAPSIRVYIRGRAKARTMDRLEITVENPSDQQLILESMHLSIGTGRAEDLSIDRVVHQMETASVSLDFGPWPSHSEIVETKAVMLARLANGLRFETEAQVQISSEEMYARSRILEDL